MVSSGLVIGFATGGFPSYSREISQLALALGMTFAMTEISFANISARTEFRRFVVSLVASYGALSGLILIIAIVSPDPGIHDGWVLMASVPPAIAVVPITSYLRGDTRRTVVSLAVFASFKNLGLTVVLAFAVFGPIATLPSIVSLVCEILWLASLPFVFRGGEKEVSATGQPS